MSGSGIFPLWDYEEFSQRKSIYYQAQSAKGSLYMTYKRHFVAAEWVGRIGWILDLFTAIIGAVLLYILTRDPEAGGSWFAEISSLEPADLAIFILTFSLVSAFYGPKLRSRDYYNDGQEMHELYDQYEYFIELDVFDPDAEVEELREKLSSLNSERHGLNQSTAQLSGIWYRVINGRRLIDTYIPIFETPGYEQDSFEDKMNSKFTDDSSSED